MDIFDIIAIAIPFVVVLMWVVIVLITYVIIPKRSIPKGFQKWWEDNFDDFQ